MSRFSGGFTTQQAGNSRHDSRDTQLIDWLLEEDQPSVRYHTLVDLLERKEDDPEVREAYSKIPRIGWARDILRLQKPKGFWELHEPTNVREWLNFLRVPEYVATTWRPWPPMPLCQSRSDPGRLSSPSREELSSIWKEDCSRKGESTSLGSDSTIRITSTTTFWLGLT